MEHIGKLSVSVMCADLLNLESGIRDLERYGADMLHIDVMDAHFVPNLTFGPDFIKAIRKKTTLPLDCHFMVTDPELMAGKIRMREGDIFTAHAELLDHHWQGRSYSALSESIRSQGARFGLGLNPGTPAEALEKHLPYIDTVLLMLVHPGFSGSRMIPGIIDKVGEVRRFLDLHSRRDVEIIVDGAVSREAAALAYAQGASIFVGGSAGIFLRDSTLEQSIAAFREAIGG